MANKQVDRRAQCRIRDDARVTVRATALQSDDDIRRGNGFARDGIRVGQHLVDHRDTVRDGFGGSARVLDRERAKQRPFFEPLGAKERADLVRFAAEADDQHAGKIDVPRIAAQGAPQELHPFAVRVHPAAGPVRQGHDAVDVRKCGKCGAPNRVKAPAGQIRVPFTC